MLARTHRPISPSAASSAGAIRRRPKRLGNRFGRAFTNPIGGSTSSGFRNISAMPAASVCSASRYFAWIPFVAADLGNFTGGFISGYCIRRGFSVVQRANLWVCVFSCLPMLAGIPAATVHSSSVSLGTHLRRTVGIRKLVDHGTNATL